MANQCQNAHKLRAALGLRHVFQGIEQFGVVRCIALAVGVACRVNARRAAQEVDRQPRVIGQCRQPGKACRIAGL